MVDQFGYRTVSEKIAVIRNPQVGFDAATHFTPGATYAVVDARTQVKVFEAAPTKWNNGATDSSSGDQAWWFTFSSVTAVGDYFVLDEANGVRSDVFRIADDVFRPVLVQAVRMLYYQRDGTSKPAQFAGASFADGLAHQSMCGLYSNGSSPKDLHGGWFDAGDQNEYTNWGATDVIELLRAYAERPAAFSDDTNIPESGNGVADLLDEVKWELDWLERMQDGGGSGSVLSIVGHDGASPPSADTAPCKYGPASTSATYSTAAAFALASRVFATAPGFAAAYPGYAADLATRAASAWTWASAHPNVTFTNTGLVGAGEQEVDAAGLNQKKLMAAVFLFELTQTATYKTAFDASYASVLLISSNFTDPSWVEPQDTLLEYARATGATPAVSQAILSTFKGAMNGGDHFGALSGEVDPYQAHLGSYYWGSNQIKAGEGNLFEDVIGFQVDATKNADAARAAERYVHYLHGVNPLQLVYLSRMEPQGAVNSVTKFYHSWFGHGTPWDTVGVSQFGPPPGYLTGGPNPGYTWDSCCPSSCGTGNNCGAAQLTPPAGQPDQKAYLQFNDSWPIDSWSVTEPDDAYQAHYIRLLSKFVN